MASQTHPLDKYLRTEVFPHVMCPGCGNMSIANAFLRAVDKVYGSFEKFVFVSGIGCAAWIPSPHFKADTVHTLHGRPIPVAMGIKLANPALNVVVISGDGDLVAIGGNHLLHAARRNADLLVIMVNNFNYGMTGGQLAPTTPSGAVTITTPYGNPEHALDVSKIVAEAGANYVARWTILHQIQLERSFIKALQMEGFRFIEVLSPCTSRYVPRNFGNLKNILDFFKKNTIDIQSAKRKGTIGDKILVGEFVIRDRPGLLRSIQLLREKALRQWEGKRK
ncbi:MAG: thiamine pyrophosphate-dependent enzyme [Candidatus Njordarchaeales archaeon]